MGSLEEQCLRGISRVIREHKASVDAYWKDRFGVCGEDSPPESVPWWGLKVADLIDEHFPPEESP